MQKFVNKEKWAKKMLKTKSYLNPKSAGSEDVWVIAYLLKQGLPLEKIRKKWKEIYYSKPRPEDSTFEELSFAKAYSFAKKMKLEDQDNRVAVIYQEELDFINQMDVPMWCKQYCLLCLTYVKLKQIKSFVNRLPRKYLTNLLTIARPDRHDNTEMVPLLIETGFLRKEVEQNFNHELGEYISTYHFIINILQTGGTPLWKIDDLQDTVQYFSKLKWYGVCIKCGHKFHKTDRGKKDICTRCWNEQRRNSQSLFVRLKRQKRKSAKSSVNI